jgi:hypothetical protein
MARLLVEAVRNEPFLRNDASGTGALHFYVAVAESATGQPVTNLRADNFRVALASKVTPAFQVLVEETKWPGNVASGFYEVVIASTFAQEVAFEEGQNYAFGIEVRRFRADTPIDFGQTVVSVMGVGQRVYSMPVRSA